MWLMFLFGVLFGVGLVLLGLLWAGVRDVNAQRHQLAQRRERMRP